MKTIFAKLGIKKMDEMEKSIVLKAQRNALIYVVVFLIFWSFYEFYQTHTQNTPANLMPCLLLITAAWVLILSQLFFTKRAIQGEEGYKNPNFSWKILLFGFSIGAIIIAVGTTLLLLCA